MREYLHICNCIDKLHETRYKTGKKNYVVIHTINLYKRMKILAIEIIYLTIIVMMSRLEFISKLYYPVKTTIIYVIHVES